LSSREKVHGVKTIYLVQPNEENLKKITEDFAKDLYDNVYLEFTFPIKKDSLERLALNLVKYNCMHKIKQVMQHHINFVCLGYDFFTLNIPRSYEKLHSIKHKGESENLYNIIAQSLYSLIHVLGVLPHIYYTSNGGSPSNEVFKRLEVRTRERESQRV
jgi:hypothetical protein